MGFEMKLREIIKCEIHGFITLVTILLLFLPLFYWYITDKYNPTLVLNLFGIFSVYLLFITMGFKKWKTIMKLKWSLLNYEKFPKRVQSILNIRKATLISIHGQIKLYTHYDEALQLFLNSELKNCA